MPKKIRSLKAMSSHYSMQIQWSDEDNAFVVSLTEFGPYAKTHGKTYEQAVKNGEEAIEYLVQVYRQEGRELPEPATAGVLA
jgi:predicted RNase H-like HicB family nuclease